MIRKEINIESPQKVEVIETGEIGYVISFQEEPLEFFLMSKYGDFMHWYSPEELRPLKDRLVFDVNSFDVLEAGTSFWIHGHLEGEVSSDTIYIKLGFKELNLNEYTFQVIATPKEKSLEDMTKEELIEMVKQLKK